MDRVSFFNSVQNIQYPKMIVDFFDHFIALKSIVEDSGKTINVMNSIENRSITFSIEFNNCDDKNRALNIIKSCGGYTTIYQRPFAINAQQLSKNKIQIYIEGVVT